MIRRLRWRLARRIAPVPIITDPLPPEGGVAVVYHKHGVQWSMRASRFRLKSTSKLAPLNYDEHHGWPRFEPSRTFTRFIGTVER